MQNFEVKETLATFKTSQGIEVRGNLLGFNRHSAFVEVCSPNSLLQTSEVLNEFRIICSDLTLYSGQAVVRNLLNTGAVTVCEATLEDTWIDLSLVRSSTSAENVREQFRSFLGDWQKFYRVRPEFKIIVADFQTFLTDLRLWLEQVELAIRGTPAGDRLELERQMASALVKPVVEGIDSFVERFEAQAAELPEDLHPSHRNYLRRQLHSLVLCSPFAYRTFHKPLGYAGDYEMINMMLRSPCEGSTLFAKILNMWLLGQAPVLAHRNRVAYLSQKILEETVRVQSRGGPSRIFNLGCGPAGEVQRFLEQHHLSDYASFDLLDFNQETLEFLRTTLDELRSRYHRRTPVQLIKKSAHQVLKEGSKSMATGAGGRYDLVYCAGLFDYLHDQVCKRLMSILYNLLAPGGLLVVTNVTDAMNSSRPFRYSLEYLLDWNLVYRNARQAEMLVPENFPADSVSIISENTGVNVFIQVRKPANG